jgi:hypothetical protein
MLMYAIHLEESSNCGLFRTIVAQISTQGPGALNAKGANVVHAEMSAQHTVLRGTGNRKCSKARCVIRTCKGLKLARIHLDKLTYW